jgi:hypothetical protein
MYWIETGVSSLVAMIFPERFQQHQSSAERIVLPIEDQSRKNLESFDKAPE